MNILGINTATPYTEFAFIEGEKTVLSKSWHSDYDEAEKIMPMLEDAIQTSKLKPDKLFIVEGPGSFTGLRIGITVANTLALLYDIPIISISTFAYLQAKIPSEHKDKTAILLRAGPNVSVMLPNENESHHLPLDELVTFLNDNNPSFIVSDIRTEHQSGYELPNNIKWLQLNELQPLDEILKDLESIKHKKEQKVVTPQYPAPPKITKSKKPIFT